MVEIIYRGGLEKVMDERRVHFPLHSSLKTKRALIAFLAGTDPIKTEALSAPTVNLIIDNELTAEDDITRPVQTITFDPSMIGA